MRIERTFGFDGYRSRPIHFKIQAHETQSGRELILKVHRTQ